MLHTLMGRAARRGKVLAPALAIFLAADSVVATTFNPTTSAELTTALTNAQLGDTIVLDAGTIYEGTFTLPNKTTGSGYITIQSSNLASLPAAGTRVNLSHASNMPRIRPADAFGPALKAATSAHHYKFIGLEVTGPTVDTMPDGTSNLTYAPIELGTSGTAQDTLTEVPNNFIIDRCIIRANSNLQRIKRGIYLNSASTDITNCYIADFKTAGQDGQAISGYNGPGPFNIINNFIEAATENVMFGGSVPTIPNLVPSDIVIKQNHFHKPLTWNQNHASYNGNNWSIKNLFELKNARNVLVEGNIFENHWVDSQSGWCIVLTPANDGPAPWTVVEDVTFRNNIIRGVAAGPSMIGYDQGGDVSEQSERLTFENNLFYDMGGTLWGGNGQLFLIMDATKDVHITHNTAFNPKSFCLIEYNATHGTHTGFVFVNNIVNRESGYGIKRSGGSEGNDSLNVTCTGAIFTKNVIKSGTASRYNQYPGNLFPADWSFLVDKVGGDYENGDWDIVSGHAYNDAGVGLDGTTPDGKDLGADIPAIVTATAGCISGVWPATGELSPVDDAYINGGANANTNYGAGTGLVTKWTTSGDFRRKSYMRYDLSGVSGSVSGAELRLYVQTSDFVDGTTIDVYGLNNGTAGETTWTESGITWNNAPGNDTADNDFLNATLLGQVSYSAVDTWVTLSSAALDNFINADTNDQITVMLRSTGGTFTSFSSTENSNGNGPRLAIPQASTLIASDSIAYTGNLIGQNGGTGFGSNAWASLGSYNNPALTTGSLTYTSGSDTLVTSGNKIQPLANSRAGRNFASAITTANTTKWVSFRANYTGGGTPPTNHAGFSLFSGTGASGTEIFIGKPASQTKWGVDHSGTIATTSGTFQPNAFIVCKLVFTASQVTISMWVNPALNEGSLGASHITPLVKSHTTNIASLRFSTGTNSSNYQFDEFRIGDAFNDVAPKQ